MPKYGKREGKLRGTFQVLKTSFSHLDGKPILNGKMMMDGRDNRLIEIPVTAFGDTVDLLKEREGKWIEIDILLAGNWSQNGEFLNSSNIVLEVKDLPMHKEEGSVTESSPPVKPEKPEEPEEGVPF